MILTLSPKKTQHYNILEILFQACVPYMYLYNYKFRLKLHLGGKLQGQKEEDAPNQHLNG